MDRRALLRQPFSRYLSPGEAETYHLRLKQVLETGEPQAWELGIAKRWPETSALAEPPTWVHLTVAATRAAHGLPALWVVLSDITERPEAVGRNHMERERLRNILGTIGDPVFVKDEDHRFVMANRAFCDLFGMVEQDLLGRTLAENIPANEMQHFFEVDRRVLDSGIPEMCEESLTSNGLKRSIITTKTLFIEPSGKKYLVGSSHDISERKRAEETIRRLSTVVEQSPISIVITDPSGAIEYVNAKFTEMTGYGAGEVLGQNPRILKSGALPPESYTELWATIRAGGTWRGEFHNRKKGGELFWEEATISAILDAQGTITHYVALKEDITQRKAAEAMVLEHEMLLRLFVEHSPAAIAMLDTDMSYLVVSRRWLDDYQLPQGDLVGLSHYDVFPGISEERKALHRRCLAGAIEKGEEDPFLRADGHTDWVRWEIRPWTKVEGAIGGIIIFSEVVTERRKSQEANLHLQAMLARTEGQAHIGSWEWEVATSTLSWSEEMFRILGRNPADGAPSLEAHAEFHAPEDMDRIQRAVALAVKEGLPYELELPFFRPGGEVRHCLVRGLPSRASDGAISRVFGFLQDITDRKKAEAALQESNRVLSQFISRAPFYAFIKEVTPEASRMVQVSDNFEEFMGIPSSELLGKTMAELFPADVARKLTSEDWAVASSGKSLEVEERIQGRVFSTIKFPIQQGGKALVAGCAIDITEQELSKHRLAESHEQLRTLVGRLQRVQEEERIRVSREIHDELGQLLTGLKMDVRWLERKLSEPGLPPALNPLLDRVVGTSELADAMITTVQRIASELRPSTLDRLGLEASLDLEARRFSERSGLRCTMAHSGPFPPLDPSHANDLFYIFREALTNVGRHAQATQVVLDWRIEGDTAVFVITDDGTGFDESVGTRHGSLGLTGMKERALQCGGSLAFERNTPTGTRVVVRVPRLRLDGDGSSDR